MPQHRNILIIGGSGFVGSYLMQKLIAAGDSITLLNRGNRIIAGTRQLIADRTDPDSMAKLFNGTVAYDAVIDTSSYSQQDTAIAYAVLGQSTRHWLHLSSAAVYQATSGHVSTELDPIGGSEEWGEYGIQKSQADHYLLSNATIPVTILRPPYLYGAGNNCDRETFVWSRALARKPVLVPGQGVSRIQFLHASELADIFLLCLQSPPQTSVVYNVGGNEILTTQQWVKCVADAAGLPDPTVIVGHNNLNFPARKYFPFRDCSCLLDASKIINALGWRSKISLINGISATYRAYKRNKLIIMPS